jgi:hypothetical protein
VQNQVVLKKKLLVGVQKGQIAIIDRLARFIAG